MKHTLTKRLAACLLALCLLAGMLPAPAVAAGPLAPAGDPGDIVELKPKDSYTTPGGTVTVEGEERYNIVTAIMITDTNNVVTTIDPENNVPPATVDTATGQVTVPVGSTVLTGDNGEYTITVGEGGGTVAPGGTVTGASLQVQIGPQVTVTDGNLSVDKDGIMTLPGGVTATVDHGTTATTVTVPAGDPVTMDAHGYMENVPANTTLKTGTNGPEITLPNGGEVNWDGSVVGTEVIVTEDGKTVTVTAPEGGILSTDCDGRTTGIVKEEFNGEIYDRVTGICPGTVIETGGLTITVDDTKSGTSTGIHGTTVGPNGAVTLGEYGDSTVTIKDGDGSVTAITSPQNGIITPTDGGAVIVPPGASVQTGGGPEITVDDVAVEGNVTVKPDGELTVPAGGSVSISDRTGEGTITVALPADGTIIPNANGTLVAPAGSTVTHTGYGGTTTTTLTEDSTVKPDGTVSPGDGKLADNETITLEDGTTISRTGDTAVITKGAATTTVTLPAADAVVTMDDVTGVIDLPSGSTVQTGGQTFAVTGKGVMVTPDGEIKFAQKTSATAQVKTGTDPELIFTWNGALAIDFLPTITPTEDGRLRVFDCVMQVGESGPRLDVSGDTVDPATGSVEMLPNGSVALIVGTGEDERIISIENEDNPYAESRIVTVTSTADGIEISAGGNVSLGWGIALPDGGVLSTDGETITCENGQAAVASLRYGATAAITAPAAGSFTVDQDITVVTDAAAGATIACKNDDGQEISPIVTTEANTTYHTVQFLEETTDYTCLAAQAVKSGETAAEPDSPAKDDTILQYGQHYQFVQWNDDSGTHASAYNFEAPVNGPVTIYAMWNELEHTFTGEWEQSETHHWKTCTLGGGCTERQDEAAHDATGANGACSVCGYKKSGGTETPDPLPPTPPHPSDDPDIPVEEEPACPKDETCPLYAFTDTSVGEWYHDGVHYCLKNGLMAGLGNGKFGPGSTLTRGMLAQILYNKEGRPEVICPSPFGDVGQGAWYTGAVAWAAENDIVAGYGNGKYGPSDPITREQLAAILWRYAQKSGNGSIQNGTEILRFSDTGDVANWAKEAMTWAVDRGIISGRGGGILDPKGEASRAEAASMLMRYCESVSAEKG